MERQYTVVYFTCPWYDKWSSPPLRQAKHCSNIHLKQYVKVILYTYTKHTTFTKDNTVCSGNIYTVYCKGSMFKQKILRMNLITKKLGERERERG